MRKLHVTRNDLAYDNCIRVGYCGLQNLLHFQNPQGYNSGVYGWNYDVYTFPYLTITTGYRNMVGINIDSKIIEKYEKKASAVYNDRKKVDKLLSQFIQEVYNTYFN